MTLYAVGKYPQEGQWEFCGVFSARGAAEEVCLDGSYFVAPIELNVRVPDVSTEWPGAYYPKVSGRGRLEESNL